MDGRCNRLGESLPRSLPARSTTRRWLFPISSLLLCLWPFAALAAEPTYEGQSASHWLDHMDVAPNGMQETIKAFKSMGRDAVPFLIKTLGRKPSKVGEAVDDLLYKRQLVAHVPEEMAKALPSAMRVGDRRGRAAFLIGEIGPEAEEAIPALMAILTDQSEGWRLEAEVRDALLAMGEKLSTQVPVLISFLESDDRETRGFGIRLLGSVGPKARDAVPALQGLANAPDQRVSLSAAQALWNIARQTNIVVAIYARSLQSKDSTVRQLALVYLRQMGSAAVAAKSAIQSALRDPDDSVRREAERTLQEIDPKLLRSSPVNIPQETAAAVAGLVRTIQTGDFRSRFAALEAIAVFGSDAASAVPALTEVLNAPPPDLPGHFAAMGLMNSRRCAAQALAEVGPEARSAAPLLISLLTARVDGNRAVYCKALGRIGPEAKVAVPALQAAIQDENRGIRLAAAVALTRIMPEQCSDAVAVLRSLQNDPELANVGIVDKDGLVNTNYADAQNPGAMLFRLAALVPLWELRVEKESPVDAIIRELRKPTTSEQNFYVELLGDIGPDAKAALPTLQTLLEPRQPITLRRAAAIAVRKIDPGEAAELGLPGTLGLP